VGKESEEVPHMKVDAERKGGNARVLAQKHPAPLDSEVNSFDFEWSPVRTPGPRGFELEVADQDFKLLGEKGENVACGGEAMEEQLIDLWSVRCWRISVGRYLSICILIDGFSQKK
jgi:hypothetical protein